MKKFETKLADPMCDGWSGFGSGPSCSPRDYATELFKTEIPGPWLFVYMFRRFGWPNVGGDPYKDIACWNLTTPIKGLGLLVSPYMGADGTRYDQKEKFNCCNLHFAVRFTEDIGKKIQHDPGRESFFKRRYKFVQKWWKTTGIKLYAWGVGLKEGDEDELVHKYCDHKTDKKLVFGLWIRKPGVKNRDIPKRAQMVDWWLAELLKNKHPEVELPQMTKRERGWRTTAFQLKAKRALQAAMKDLLRATNVRDISFTPFGDIERTPQAVEKFKHKGFCGYFKGAGMTPEYYFSKASEKEKAGED